jgi:hypothetical protein
VCMKFESSGMLCRVASLEWTDVSEVHTEWYSFITLMTEAVCTSETSAHSNETTRCYIPEDTKLLVQYYLVICSQVNTFECFMSYVTIMCISYIVRIWDCPVLFEFIFKGLFVTACGPFHEI